MRRLGRSRSSSRTSRVIAILGMHRSGTSWLTGALQELGLELGEVSTSNVHNKKGNRESRALREIHESVLERNGGSWRSPTWPNRWTKQQRAQLARYVAQMSERYDVWGFKDPRALLLLDEWHRQVQQLERVGIYRHPIAVYRSLHARHPDFSRDEAIELWKIYNTRLLDEHRSDPFPVLRFDVPRDVLATQLKAVAELLGLDRTHEADTFFDLELVHNRETEPVPSGASDVWGALQELCLERTA